MIARAPEARPSHTGSPFVLGAEARRYRRLAILALLAVWAFALGATAAAGLLWLSPLGLPLDASLWVRLGVTVLLGGGLICFAATGSRSEMHFDTDHRLVREMLRCPSGRLEQVTCWRFDEFSGVEIRARRDARRMMLCAELCLSGRRNTVRVAKGSMHEMLQLARRIETDLGLPPQRHAPLFRRRRRRTAR